MMRVLLEKAAAKTRNQSRTPLRVMPYPLPVWVRAFP
jgi:hypothetical protein